MGGSISSNATAGWSLKFILESSNPIKHETGLKPLTVLEPVSTFPLPFQRKSVKLRFSGFVLSNRPRAEALILNWTLATTWKSVFGKRFFLRSGTFNILVVFWSRTLSQNQPCGWNPSTKPTIQTTFRVSGSYEPAVYPSLGIIKIIVRLYQFKIISLIFMHKILTYLRT